VSGEQKAEGKKQKAGVRNGIRRLQRLGKARFTQRRQAAKKRKGTLQVLMPSPHPTNIAVAHRRGHTQAEGLSGSCNSPAFIKSPSKIKDQRSTI